MIICTKRRAGCFNPRARGGRDAIDAEFVQPVTKVSIHAPAGGATKDDRFLSAAVISFNPRARGGRDMLILAIR